MPFGSALLLAIFLMGTAPALAAAGGLSPCELTGSRGIEAIEAECLDLEVPENPDEPEGTRISLRVAVVRSPSPAPETDAFTLINGGPGGSSITLYADSAAAFAPILVDRDILIVDQRGTGASHPLNCPALDDLASGLVPELITQATDDCLDRLPGDPRFYTTSNAVLDLEAVRTALGYSRLNIYGVSYGTRVAQHYARRFPQAVRTLVLDGIVPADVALGPNAAINAQQTLNRLFDRCANSPDCAAAFPHLPETFDALRARLSANAVSVVLPDPITGASRTIDFGYNHLLLAVRMMSYAPETSGLIPLMIQQAQADQNFTPLAAAALRLEADLGQSMSVGMHNSVVCTEDIPYLDSIDWPGLDATYMGAEQLKALQLICERWPAGYLHGNLREPLAAGVPTLLLSGTEDPITPPEYGDAVAAHLPNALHLVAPGQGHGVFARGCLPRLISEFIEHADLSLLDAGCIERLEATPFFLDMLGPAP